MNKENVSKLELINYFLCDNKSGYKTKEKHVLNNFVGLIDLINDYNNKFFIENTFPFTQKLYNYLYNIIEIPKCINCGAEIKWRGIFTEGYLTYCSKQCKSSSKIRIERAKKTCLERYGVNSPLKLDEFKNKRSDTILNKYNVSNIFEHPDVKEKTKQTNLLKYGKEFAIQSDVIKTKRNDNNFIKYGVNNPQSLDTVKTKRKNNNILKYGVEYPQLLDTYKLKMAEKYKNNFNEKMKQKNYIVLDYLENDIIIMKHPDGHVFEIPKHIANSRFNINIEISTKLLPLGGSVSSGEIEIREFLKTLNINYITGDRSILDGNEIDIYLSDFKKGIEFDGLYWHSELFKDKYYHLNKTNECEKQGIELIHIFEDEWINKKEIVKSIIKSKLNIFDNKILACECTIKEIDKITCSNFLDNNHIEGNIESKIRIGLFHNDELVSIMVLNTTNIEDEFEINRLCNKLNTQVLGGASKLLTHFINSYQPKSIIAIVDRRYSQGSLYKELGFEFIENIEPRYWYFMKNETIHYNSFKFRKDVLINEGFDSNKTEFEIMNERGYLKIYDCGSMKYI